MIATIYIIGIVLAGFLCFLQERTWFKEMENYRFTLGDLILIIITTIFSWLSVFVLLIVLSNKVILFRRPHSSVR